MLVFSAWDLSFLFRCESGGGSLNKQQAYSFWKVSARQAPFLAREPVSEFTRAHESDKPHPANSGVYLIIYAALTAPSE